MPMMLWRGNALVPKYEDPVLEAQFEECWCEPWLLVGPLLLFNMAWVLVFVQHKTQDGFDENLGQIALAAASLSVPLFTLVLCLTRSTSAWLRSWYHVMIAANAIVVMLFQTAVGLYDEFALEPQRKCPGEFYACPHHGADAAAISITWLVLGFINILSSCLVKYKVILNIVIILVFFISGVVVWAQSDVQGLSRFRSSCG